MAFLSKIIQLDQTQFTKLLSGQSISQNGNTVNSYNLNTIYSYDKFVPEWSKGADMSIRSYKSIRSNISIYSKYAKLINAFQIGTNTINYTYYIKNNKPYIFQIPLLFNSNGVDKYRNKYRIRYSQLFYFEGDINDSTGTLTSPYFKSTSSEMNSQTLFDKVYVSNDSIIRWKSKANFGAELRNSGAMDGRWVLKSGDTMTGALNVKGNGSSRANINLISTGNVPNDLYFGSNNSSHWSISSRESGDPYIGLYNVSQGWAIKVNYGNNYVGIGTTSPSYKLHISGDSYTTGLSRAASGFYVHDQGVNFTSQGTVGAIQMTSSNEFVWASSASTLYFNYRATNRGTTVTNYVWNAGSSSTYATHIAGVYRTAGESASIGINFNNAGAWFNSIGTQVILRGGNLRFGGSGWDWNVWAGLKYDNTNKIIYLGLADGSVFNANSAQNNGSLRLPGIEWISFNNTSPFYNTTSGTTQTSRNANDMAYSGHWYYTSNGPSTSLGASTSDGALYSQAYSTSWVAQIAQDYRNGGLYVRGKNNGTWQSWYRVYDSRTTYVSGGKGYIGSTEITQVNNASNAENATQLKTSRNLWGQSFNGTADVNGNIYIDTGDTDKFIQFRYNTNNYAGSSWRLMSRGSGSGDTNYFDIETGGSSASANTWYRVIRLTMDNRRVGIGIDSPSYKLHVSGDIYSTGYIRAASGFVKSSSSNSYVLLGGGSHKLESNLSVHDADYADYATALRGGTQITDLNDATTLNQNKIYYHNGNASNRPNTPGKDGTTTDGSGLFGNIFQISNQDNPSNGTQNHWITQLDFIHHGPIYYRTRTNTDPWSSWQKIITSRDLPVGVIMMWPSSTPPTNWLICNGTTFSSTNYPDLYNILGSTTLPDFRSRFPLGAGSSITEKTGTGENNGSTKSISWKTTGGESIHKLSVNEIPRHRHKHIANADPGDKHFGIDTSHWGAISGDTNASYSAIYWTDYTGGGYFHNNLPPYIGVYFIIKAR